MYKPKISVLIPCYNAVEFIEETVDSVTKQNYSNLEIIVRDDSSTDGTWELLLELRKKFPIKTFRNTVNLGMCGNWNQLFKDADGDLILKVDADDILAPDFLNNAVNIFTRHTNVDAVAFAFDILENSTKQKNSLPVHESLTEGLQENLVETIFFKNPFALCFTIFKATSLKVLINGSYFLETEIGDLDFLLRFAKNDANLYYLKRNGGLYRHHTSNSSKIPLKQAKSWINDVFPLHQKYLKKHLYKKTKMVLKDRVVSHLKNCIYHRQKIDFDYLKVSLLTYLKF